MIIDDCMDAIYKYLEGRIILYCIQATILLSSVCYSQNKADTLSEQRTNAVRVYVDCRNCDNNYLRTNITFINYVRDRADAQVHILVTTQETGGGGREYTITFIGKQNYQGIDDTLNYVSKESDTEDNTRAGIARTMKLGLIRYASKTPLSEKISISYSEPSKPTAVVDSWDFWVFQTSVNGYLNGQSSTNSTDIYGSLSANRVTPNLKINLSINGSYGENKYYDPDADTLTYSSFSRSRGMWGLLVFSLTDHWSTGVYTTTSTSTYRNERLSWSVAPAIEYNIFPYEESTRRQLRISYNVSFNYRDYEEETIYFKTSERLYKESLEAELEQKETWGTIDLSISASHYFHDFNKYKLYAYGSVSLRLIEGLSLRFSGNASKVHDQLSLPRSGATAEEILTRQRELATQYYYWGSIGFSYTFGSIYNNVVNPRFGD